MPSRAVTRPSRTPSFRALAAASSIASLLASPLGCHPYEPDPPPRPAVARHDVKPEPGGTGFHLREGAPESSSEASARATTTPLTGDETRAVLARLPPLTAHPDDAKPLALRGASAPPPRPGETVQEAFPPPASSALAPSVSVAPLPLRVLRHEPDGPVPLAPYLTVTFSEPMVPVTSHRDLGLLPVPVKLAPQPPGSWRWVGATTALFQPVVRFPMASDYAVEVPAGTKSASGALLAESQRFTFATPAPTWVEYGPNGSSVPLEALVYARFDQAIDPARMLEKVSVTEGGKGGAPVPMRLATAEEQAADKTLRNMLTRLASLDAEANPRDAGTGLTRLLVMKASRPFRPASTIHVALLAGATGAEGPKGTTRDQSFSFTSHGDLRAVQQYCVCQPQTPITIVYSNELDADLFDKSWVKVDPPMAEMRVNVTGSEIAVYGRKKGSAKTTVTVSRALTDVFGQTIGHDDVHTFDVGRADPVLIGETRAMVVLDPTASRPSVTFHTVNEPAVRVRLYAVSPRDYPAYLKWRSEWDLEGKDAGPPGRLALDTTVTPRGSSDFPVATDLDLSPALSHGLGQVVAVIESNRPYKERWERVWLRTWYQSTRLGLAGTADLHELVAWATTLADGAPLSGVTITSGTTKAVTETDGTARLEAGRGPLVAAKGDDVTFLPDGVQLYDYHPPPNRFFTFDDRKTYKPGEPVRVKGWWRELGFAKGGDVGLPADAAQRKVRWIANDARGAEMSKGEATVSALGGFDFSVTTPKNANLGPASVLLSIDGTSGGGYHSFSIQEFRRPEFEVSASVGKAVVFGGEHGDATASATYYAGGALPNADVTWTATASDTSFTPPNTKGYAFGRQEWGRLWGSRGSAARPRTATLAGRTDAHGSHHLRVDFDPLDPPYPMSLSLSASVMDVNRQAWTARASMLVHPAEVYVGIKLVHPFVRAGSTADIDALVVDTDGKPVDGRKVVITAARLTWERARGGGYDEKENDPQTCEVISKADASRCSLPTKAGGEYRLTATVEDTKGRKNRTVTRVWVLSGDASASRGRRLQGEGVELVADKASYAPGDTAEVLVSAPFAPAEGMLVVARQGILKTERFHMASTLQTVQVAIDASLVPNVHAVVMLVGASPPEDDDPARRVVDAGPPPAPKPAYASGSIDLTIPPASRTLDVKVAARQAALAPGASTAVDVDVKDDKGAEVADAEVALVVVDESILALSGYTLPDPQATFYSRRSADVVSRGTRELVVLPSLAGGVADTFGAGGLGLSGIGEAGGGFGLGNGHGSIGLSSIGTLAHQNAAFPAVPMARMKASASPAASASPDLQSAIPTGSPIALRSDFHALALFEPALRTDAHGHVDVPLKLPESLTRYRVMAVVAAGERSFGSRESSVTVRSPLMVRPSAPRFLTLGDTFELPVVVQNQTDAPMRVSVAVRAENAHLGGPSGQSVEVPPRDRVEVRFPSSTDRAGTARFDLVAASGAAADASHVELPVWTPATSEAFATYGVLDKGAVAQPVTVPSGVFPEYGGLEVTTSSTALQGLTDAVLYLVHYPFECNEQLASRVLAIAALRDVLTAFHAEGLPPPEALGKSVADDLAKLKSRQKPDGGWGYWWHEEDPFVTVHVAHALARAAAKGYAVDAGLTGGALAALRAIESRIPSWYSQETRRAVIAYALYVRRLMKDPDPARARRLLAEYGPIDKVNLESLGWLWSTLSDDAASKREDAELRRVVVNRAVETAGAAHFASSYGDGDYLVLRSDYRADALLLEALIVDQPTSDLVPKLVKGLLAHRKAGRWGNTQENAFVLLALDRYFEKYEAATPDFLARVWLGDRVAGAHAFRGRSTACDETDIPMDALGEVGSGNVTLAKEGAGRLYYRIGMRYAPSDLRPDPIDRGFTVTRTYEPVDDPADVSRDADGVWHFKAGKTIRVRVTMLAPSRRTHVALVDPLPAGVEPMNPALAVTGPVPQDPAAQSSRRYWAGAWYAHQNLRDERAEAFATLVWEGVHEYVYTVRATTPGTFVAGPPKAEEMYSPEVFGRGAGDIVVVN